MGNWGVTDRLEIGRMRLSTGWDEETVGICQILQLFLFTQLSVGIQLISKLIIQLGYALHQP